MAFRYFVSVLMCMATAARSMSLASLSTNNDSIPQAPRAEDYAFGLVIPLNSQGYDTTVFQYGNNANSNPPLSDYTHYMNGVRNQGKCGSCYAFATVAAIEALVNMAAETLHTRLPRTALSPSDVVDCSWSAGDFGCSGGYPANVMEYAKWHGVCPEASYPYNPVSGTCRLHACSSLQRQHVRAHGRVQASSHLDLASALAVHGPLVVGIDATGLKEYKPKGPRDVYSNCTSDPSQLDINHAVVLVGLVQQGTTLAWKLQNSWGTAFGVDGYFFMEYHHFDSLSPGDCGLLTDVTFGVV